MNAATAAAWRYLWGREFVSGIVLLILLIGLLYAGGPVLLTAMLVISLIGLYEFYRALSNQHKPFQIIGLAAAILYYGVLLFREEWVRDGNFGLFFFIGLFWILMVLAVFSYPERRTGGRGADFCRSAVCSSSVFLCVLFASESGWNAVCPLYFLGSLGE